MAIIKCRCGGQIKAPQGIVEQNVNCPKCGILLRPGALREQLPSPSTTEKATSIPIQEKAEPELPQDDDEGGITAGSGLSLDDEDDEDED